MENNFVACRSTAGQPSLVSDWAARLIAQEPLCYPQLLPLFRRTLDEVRSVRTLSGLLPLPGLPPGTLAESPQQPLAAILVEGLTAARVIAWTLHDESRAAGRLPLLVLAAMLQDIGRLVDCIRGATAGRRRATRAAWVEQQHPALGAGLLGTIRGAPVELALMVGQHHERLDGGGRPRALTARDILPEAAVLAAATRFARLALELDVEPQTPGAADYGPAGIAYRLLAEAQWGMWDVEFAARLAERAAQAHETPLRVVPEVPAESPPHDRLENHASGRDGRRRQLHGREPGLPGLHAGMGRRFSEPGWYEKKMLIERESR